ncbi:unnamed protein product [Phaedon cochleariae]|uniref:CRAL-TRIO domain-containing protein n=1 Tax=Phaedon cochleariae TaxID=80249 RepID=A0A9P0DEC1_PHACE|nr:unnamed protein product [Phaedon cochleariae]
MNRNEISLISSMKDDSAIDEMPVEEKRMKAELNIDEPSEELLEWAKENINENPDKTDLLISDLRDMIFEKGECIPHRTDDKFLLRFLRARHFIVPKAHRLIVNYFDFRESTPYFENIDVHHLRKLSKTMFLCAPPYTDQCGRRMLILKIGEWDTDEYSIVELFQLIIGIIEIALLEPQIQIKGAVLIVDLSDLSLKLTLQMTPTVARHIICVAMTSFPIRLQSIHFINATWLFDMAWSILKSLVTTEVLDRVVFHPDYESLHTHVDPKYLPTRYGGIHLDYPMDIWFEDVVMKDDRVVDEWESMGFGQIRVLKEEEEAKRKRKD